MKETRKQKVLKDLADALDFKEVLRKNPDLSMNALRDILYEASSVFAEKAAIKCHRILNINVDGASRGNPGKSGIGIVISDRDGSVIERIGRYIGIATNNAAEYNALISAMDAAKALGADEINIYADSELMVKHINGEYQVRNEGLKPLYQKAADMLKGFKRHGIIHIERGKNKEADRLANQAIDDAG